MLATEILSHGGGVGSKSNYEPIQVYQRKNKGIVKDLESCSYNFYHCITLS